MKSLSISFHNVVLKKVLGEDSVATRSFCIVQRRTLYYLNFASLFTLAWLPPLFRVFIIFRFGLATGLLRFSDKEVDFRILEKLLMTQKYFRLLLKLTIFFILFVLFLPWCPTSWVWKSYLFSLASLSWRFINFIFYYYCFLLE